MRFFSPKSCRSRTERQNRFLPCLMAAWISSSVAEKPARLIRKSSAEPCDSWPGALPERIACRGANSSSMESACEPSTSSSMTRSLSTPASKESTICGLAAISPSRTRISTLSMPWLRSLILVMPKKPNPPLMLCIARKMRLTKSFETFSPSFSSSSKSGSIAHKCSLDSAMSSLRILSSKAPIGVSQGKVIRGSARFRSPRISRRRPLLRDE
ncbi:MAG: hypothetical protein BWZ10_02700 [candidate division BRC1 bacterium ADurb.BinA364]|nr:MAG: hypothetical protein BWZ10_02700 [candidate division BRC1 bacterium ADurb.BinA364]